MFLGSYQHHTILASYPYDSPAPRSMQVAIFDLKDSESLLCDTCCVCSDSLCKKSYPPLETALAAYSVWKIFPSGEKVDVDKSYCKSADICKSMH